MSLRQRKRSHLHISAFFCVLQRQVPECLLSSPRLALVSLAWCPPHVPLVAALAPVLGSGLSPFQPYPPLPLQSLVKHPQTKATSSQLPVRDCPCTEQIKPATSPVFSSSSKDWLWSSSKSVTAGSSPLPSLAQKVCTAGGF